MKDLPLRTLNKETFLVPGATYERLSQLLELQDIYFGSKNAQVNTLIQGRQEQFPADQL